MRIKLDISPMIIFVYFLVFGLFRPGCFSELGMIKGGVWAIINNMYIVWGVVDYLVIIILSFIYLNKIPIVIVPIALLRLFIIIRDVHFSLPIGQDLRVLGMHLSMILCICVFEGINMEYKLMKGISNILSIYIIINFITILFYKDGFYIDHRGWRFNYFLGYKNSHIYTYLPYILTTTVSDYISNKSVQKKHMIMFMIILASTIFAGSSTDMIVIGLIIVGFIFVKLGKVKYTFNVVVQMLLSMGISFGIIVINFQTRLLSFLTNLLNKDTTYSQRIRIWESSIYRIMQHPIGGNGNADVELLNYRIGNLSSFTQAHNMYLDLIYQGGMITLSLFVFAIVITYFRMKNFTENLYSRYIHCILGGYFVLFLMEANRTNASFYLLLGICWVLPNMIKKNPMLNQEVGICE